MRKNSPKPKGVELSDEIKRLLNANKVNDFIAVVHTSKLKFLENVFCLTFSESSQNYSVKTGYEYLTEPNKDCKVIATYLAPNQCAQKYFELMEGRCDEKQ